MTLCYPAELGHSISNGTSVDPSEKFDSSRHVFQGHSKVIGTDTDRFAAYDFLFTFHSNLGIQ